MVYLSLPHRNSLPLFFLWVRTNVSYAAVGVFVIQTETKEVIVEALKVFQKWNSDWNPSHFMAGFCEAEIGALEEVFKGTFGSLSINLLLVDRWSYMVWSFYCFNSLSEQHIKTMEMYTPQVLRIIYGNYISALNPLRFLSSSRRASFKSFQPFSQMTWFF